MIQGDHAYFKTTEMIQSDHAYRYLLRREELVKKITFFLQPITTDKKIAIKKLRQTMAEIGQEAQYRGLTPEILEEILNENDKSENSY